MEESAVPVWGQVPVAAAAAIAGVEAASWVFPWQMFPGGIPLAPTAVFVTIVALFFWTRRPARLSVALWLAALVAATFVVTLYFEWISASTAAGLLAAATLEEVTYRVAIPVLIVAALRRVGVRSWVAPVVAAVGVSVLFASLPGHVAQYSASALGPIPWMSMSIMWTWMLWRGVPLVVVAAHHASLNAVAFSVAAGAPGMLWPLLLLGSVGGVAAVEWGADLRETRADRRSATPEGVLAEIVAAPSVAEG